LRGDAASTLGDKFLPPALTFSGGEVLWLGAAKRWDTEMRQFFLSVAAVAGACERLLSQVRPYQFCVQLACPVYETALCHSWYSPPPPSQDHASCRFPELFMTMFGASPTSVMETRMRARIMDANVTSEAAMLAADRLASGRRLRGLAGRAAAGLAGYVTRRGAARPNDPS